MTSELTTIVTLCLSVRLSATSYKNLGPLGFTSWGHPQLAATGGGQPSILLWGKKDPHSDGIADIDLSYSQADEVSRNACHTRAPRKCINTPTRLSRCRTIHGCCGAECFGGAVRALPQVPQSFEVDGSSSLPPILLLCTDTQEYGLSVPHRVTPESAVDFSFYYSSHGPPSRPVRPNPNPSNSECESTNVHTW